MNALEQWKAKYYPTPAADATPRNAAAHSLMKWEGLRPAVLQEFDIKQYGSTLLGDDDDDDEFPLTSSTCALCLNFIDDESFTEDKQCAKCPLAIVRGGVPCTLSTKHEYDSPWGEMVYRNNPEPMIVWLKQAVAYSEETIE